MLKTGQSKEVFEGNACMITMAGFNVLVHSSEIDIKNRFAPFTHTAKGSLEDFDLT